MEGVAVVASILLAFWIDAWRQGVNAARVETDSPEAVRAGSIRLLLSQELGG